MNPRTYGSLLVVALLASSPHALAAARSATDRPSDGLAQVEAPTANADRVPEGLAPCDWSSIRAAYEAGRRAAFAVEGGWKARNPGQQWRTRFDGRGFETTPDAGGWSWGLELVANGRGGAEYGAHRVAPVFNRCGAGAPRVTACGQRVEYRWDDSLTEWYLNDLRGLEHGYAVLRRLDSSAGKDDRGEPLHFTLAVRGGLKPRINADGRGVTFVNDHGAAVVSYAGLKVFDADGADVPARIDQSGDSLVLSVDDSDARYPLTIDPIAQQAYLKASNTGMGDNFGYSVSVSGNTVVVGANFEASNATGVNGNQADNSAGGAGAAYVFVRSGGVWTQQAYLKASNSEANDQFGASVSVSGDTVVVGALGEDSSATGVNGNQADNSAATSGAVYVFIRSGGIWTQQAYLKASNTGAGDQFGDSVSVSGDTVVVGAKNEDSNATGVNGNQANNSTTESGATYVFVRGGGIWTQQAYLKASNTGVADRFGDSVSVSGDTVVVGARDEDSNATGVNGNQADNSAADSGAAYVFVRSGATWSQQAYLKASNTDSEDFFGSSVAVSGDTVVVAAYAEDSNSTDVNGNQADNNATTAGAVYVFVRSGATWSQQAYLKASNTEAGDQFGLSVSLSRDTFVVGANGEDSNATGVNGNQADNSASNSGAAYVFVRSNGIWSQQAYLKASNTEANDSFGFSVFVSSDTVVVGANSEDSIATGVNGNQANNGATDSGATYAFTGFAPTPVLADANCDGMLNASDVSAFVLALLDPAAYAVTYPTCDPDDWEPNGDSAVDGDDVPAFVDLLIP